jgi:hypothetical protein
VNDAPIASLAMTVPVFAPAILGYSRSATEPIIITNNGNADATNVHVTVSDASLFEITGSGSTVTSGSTLSAWTIQPALGLSVGTHAATITVEYDTNKTAAAIVSFTVDEPVNAQTPTISTQPENVTVTAGNPASLSVIAYVTDGGILSYQWYSNSTDSNTSGTAISGATGASYSPDTSTAGTYYYYAVVVNTNISVSGSTTAAISGDAATLTVNRRLIGGSSSGSGGGSGFGSSGVKAPAVSQAEVTTESPLTANNLLTANNPFGDLKDSDWFFDSVMFAYSQGLMTGTSVNTMLFSPNAPATRGMLVTILHRLEGSPVAGGTADPFSDVASGLWYSEAVKWAVDKGIVSGYGDSKFGPGDEITREQMALILYNYMKFKGYTIPAGSMTAFADEAIFSSWSPEAIRAIQGLGIINGKPGNVFDPRSTATRAEVAAIFKRYAEYAARGV